MSTTAAVYGAWNAETGKCYADECTRLEARIVADRAARLVTSDPIFVGTEFEAKKLGYKNARGENY